jgi:hypothetical protein
MVDSMLLAASSPASLYTDPLETTPFMRRSKPGGLGTDIDDGSDLWSFYGGMSRWGVTFCGG